MLGITNTNGIPQGKLNHIFLGTVRGGVSGFHCDSNFGDELVYAKEHFYPRSKRVIAQNRLQKVFEAYVYAKGTNQIKKENGGKSTFFNQSWTRQEIVDCIARVQKSGKSLKEYSLKNQIKKSVYVDPKTNLVVVDTPASTYPLLKY